MPEEITPPEGEPVTPPEATPPPEEEQRVPYDRFKQVNDERAALATQVEELAAWKKQQEEAQLSEQERLQAQHTEAVARAEAAEQRALTLERSQWVTAAARTAGFADPADAALAVNLSEVEDEQAAKQAVEQLAVDKPHWLSQAKPSGFGTIGDRQNREEAPPLGEDGKPDMRAGLGKELAKSLLGGR